MSDSSRQLAAIREVYGPNADIYADVLRVSRDATPAEIREAYFCLRYDANRRLEAAGTNDDATRANVEARMDAMTAGYHVLGDPARRKAYDDAIASGAAAPSKSNATRSTRSTATLTTRTTTLTTDDMGFPVASNVSPLSPPTTAAATTTTTTSSASSTHHPIAREGGMNSRPRPSPLLFQSQGGRQSPSWTDFDGVNNDDDDQHDRRLGGSGGASWFPPRHPPAAAVTASRSQPAVTATTTSGRLGSRYGALDGRRIDRGGDNDYGKAGGRKSATLDSPTGVGDLDRRRGGKDRVQEDMGATTTGQPRRGDDPESSSFAGSKCDEDEDEEDDLRRRHGRANCVLTDASRVDAAATPSYSRRTAPASRMMKAASHRAAVLRARRAAAAAARTTKRRAEKFVEVEDNDEEGEDEEGEDEEDEKRSAPPVETDDDNDDDLTNGDSRTNDGDCTTEGEDDDTYNDETTMGDTYADDATMGDTTYADDTTIGESTWASHDASSFATREEDPARFSPRHKQGNMPEPILKSGIGKMGHGRSRIESDGATSGRRVTIHSHRGRGEHHDDEFSLFESGMMCPSLRVVQEEMNGTYQDLTRTWNQVTGAFIITPDDIDRLSDKLRDAKIELGEQYVRQVLERSGSPQRDPPVALRKKRQVKKK
jgi:hypothetical protein